VTTIEESKDLEEMKIEKLIGSLQTYEYSLPPVRKAKTIAFKTSKKKTRVSSDEALTLKKMLWQCWPRTSRDS
jgi:arginine repressor